MLIAKFTLETENGLPVPEFKCIEHWIFWQKIWFFSTPQLLAVILANWQMTFTCFSVWMGWVWVGNLCAGWFYEHSFAVPIIDLCRLWGGAENCSVTFQELNCKSAEKDISGIYNSSIQCTFDRFKLCKILDSLLGQGKAEKSDRLACMRSALCPMCTILQWNMYIVHIHDLALANVHVRPRLTRALMANLALAQTFVQPCSCQCTKCN